MATPRARRMTRTKKILIGVAVAGGAAIGLAVNMPANAESISVTTINGTGATQIDAVKDAIARCESTGGAQLNPGQFNSAQNADGSFNVTIACLNPF